MMLFQSRSAADAAAERLKVYAQPQRLMILSLLMGGEHTVSDIEKATGIGQPALSQQLAELRRAEIVRTRKESKQVYYRLADDKVIACVRGVEAMFGGGAVANLPAVADASVSEPAAPARAPVKGAAMFARVGSTRSTDRG
jgi:DNA-binding transcriptional ArsR family regulator